MLDIIKNAARKAGEIQKKYFHSADLDIANKTNH